MFLVLRVNRVYSYTLHNPLFTPHRRPGYKAPHQCFGRWPNTQSDSSLRVKKSQTLLYSVLRRMTDLLWTFGLAAPNYCIDPCQLYEYMSTLVDSVDVGHTLYTKHTAVLALRSLTNLFTLHVELFIVFKPKGLGRSYTTLITPPPPIHKPLFEN